MFARAFLASTAIVGTGFALPAMAQTIPPAPVRQSVDPNGVDLFLGTVNVDGPALTAGAAGSPSISYYNVFRGSAFADSVTARFYISGSTVTISFGTESDRFTVSGTTYRSTEGSGATLTYNATTTIYSYTTSSGVVYHFKNQWGTNGAQGGVADIVYPSGRTLTYTYQQFVRCKTHLLDDPSTCTQYVASYALSKVVSNDGYELDFNREGDTDEFPGQFLGVSMKNTVSGSTTVRSQTYDDQSIDGTVQITDQMSRLTKYRFSLAGVVGITHPGRTAEDVTIIYDTSNRAASVTNPVGTTTYGYADSAGVRTTTVTDPGGHSTVYTFDIASQRMLSITNPLSKTVSKQYDTSGRLTRVTAPEGNYTQYTYDARGNVTETRTVAKSGSGLADIVTAAGYDTTCANTATCNSPNWIRDAIGNQTDYTYGADFSQTREGICRQE
ncbi:hypothetical protein GCM10009087_53080 [Sphingomonas oligophenolica]|uniref:RHS repeat protein n=1 Tax=Sphingomonas oligophenolica TaxID=301154 RepID=A0ABU9Y7I9_9SPHN